MTTPTRKSVMDDYSGILKRQKELRPDPKVVPDIPPAVNGILIQAIPLKEGGESLKLTAANLPHMIVYNSKTGKRYRSASNFDGYVYEIDEP